MVGILSKKTYRNYLVNPKVSVQEVVELGVHFATLCQELDFHEAIFFFIVNIQKEKANTVTLLIILTMKSPQIELHSTNLVLCMTSNLLE